MRLINISAACLLFLLLLSGSSHAQGQQAGSSSNTKPPASNPAPQPSIMAEPISLETPTGKLYGTLELPKSPGPYPLALIIAGSGPTDRNGNTPLLPGANNSLKMLAEGLAAQGIASLRYDKRGVAESAKAITSEADLRFETYIDDAVLWGKQLRQDKRFSTITIIGHSEGSLIGMVAAQRMKADGYVSIAGAGHNASQIILEQARNQVPPDFLVQIETILKSLNEGKTVENVPPNLMILFRPSVQPYMISWFKYDPAKEVGKLSMPVLILQGTTDIQASPEEAKLLSQANQSAKLVIIEGMNHVLKQVPAEQEQQMKSYSDPAIPVSPRLINEISGFIKALKK